VLRKSKKEVDFSTPQLIIKKDKTLFLLERRKKAIYRRKGKNGEDLTPLKKKEGESG